jgi:cyclic pyranopterin monophosphate synthase
MDEPSTSGTQAPSLTHIDARGAARMVDVGDKPVTRRVARAGARVWMAERTLALLEQIALPKGDVLAVARVAGIQAAKRTAELIPMCHPLSLTHVELAFTVHRPENRVDIECIARTDGKTGVEMEALTGVSVAALTIYDMCKAVDRGMIVGDVRLLEKTGGKEDYVRPEGSVIGEALFVAADPGAPALEEDGGTGVPVPSMAGTVLSVNVSPGKGERKKPVERVSLRVEHGIEGDGHAGPWHRQVSLLAQESIDTMVAKGLDVGPGDFAENITTRGVHLYSLPVGTRMRIGEALVELTQIGKVCHDRCAIYYQAGDCVMPREGIFVRVVEGGAVVPGDRVVVLGPTVRAAR